MSCILIVVTIVYNSITPILFIKIVIIKNKAYLERANLKHQIITRDNKIFFTDETLKFWFEEANEEKVLILERRDLPNLLRLKKTKNN